MDILVGTNIVAFVVQTLFSNIQKMFNTNINNNNNNTNINNNNNTNINNNNDTNMMSKKC
jgi:hypothetical protein